MFQCKSHDVTDVQNLLYVLRAECQSSNLKDL